ncbi:hypothetical protein FO519_008688 [Halicephalobus sp. NKZ332]|nr:hypothetical protein FO519_008688 [Halicephalobus sp. NKZ332]
MKTLWILGLVLLLFLVVNDASPLNKRKPIVRKRHMVMGRPFHGFLPGGIVDPKKQKAITDTHFTQKLDHFDDSNTATFQQHYWYNDGWYKPGGPQFLMIGGESAGNPFWVIDGDTELGSLAKEVGAMVFLLEHRFYGSTQPTSNLDYSSLKYFTSEQALADVNDFITGMNSELNITKPRWITFGGSYSGALSAWARQVYPNNVYAAVASSAPVQLVVDMTGYMDTVYHALNNYDPVCATSVYRGVQQMNSLVKTDSGRSQLSSLFKTCTTLSSDPDDLAFFFENILSCYMFVVQYSEDNTLFYDVGMTIPELCRRQTDASVGDDLARVAGINSWIMGIDLEFCQPVEFKEYIDSIKNAKAGTPEGDERGWTWQTCNEFGYFQTTDSPLVIANLTGENVVPVDWYVKQCGQIFDSSYNNATIYSKVNATNTYYKGNTGYSGTKVSFPNGSNDPWHVLGVITPTNNKVYPILIDGTSHCADMYPPKSNDKPSLTQARASVRTHVISWVNE